MSLLSWEDGRPRSDEYDDFYNGYIALVTSPSVIQTLIQQGQQTHTFIQKLTPDEAAYRYADNKWSVQEVIGHLIDTERIMTYRALCISRRDKTPLPGYDHESYVKNAHFENRNLQSLSIEYDALRNATISMFHSFSKDQLTQKSTANNVTVSVRALAYIIAGHERHHLNILEENYEIDIQ